MIQEPLIHIGYHKTGTTWLQNHLFASDAFEQVFDKHEIRDLLVLPKPFDFNAEKIITSYQSKLNDNAQIPVISSERLSGAPSSGGFDSKEIADRLHQCFPKGKVLIVIREQIDAIASSYLQHIRVGGTSALKNYLAPPVKFQGVSPGFDLSFFDYLPLVKYYIELFGKDNVLVLPFELFKESPEDFCHKIFDFSHSQELASLPYKQIKNESINHLSSKIVRQLNKVFAKSAFNPNALDLDQVRQKYIFGFLKLNKVLPKALVDKAKTRNQDKIKSMVAGEFSESNRELGKYVNLDLEKYGYAV